MSTRRIIMTPRELYNFRVANLARARAIKAGLISQEEIKATSKPPKPIKTPEELKQAYIKKLENLKYAREIKAIRTEARQRNNPNRKRPKKITVFDFTYSVLYRVVPKNLIPRYERRFARNPQTLEQYYKLINTTEGKYFISHDLHYRTQTANNNVLNFNDMLTVNDDIKNETLRQLNQRYHQYEQGIIILAYDNIKSARHIYNKNQFKRVKTMYNNYRVRGQNYIYEDMSGDEELSGVSEAKRALNKCWYEFLINNGFNDNQIKKSFDINNNNGVEMYKLYEFCINNNRSVYITDISKNIIFKNVHTEGKHKPAIIGYVANNHIYNVEDSRIREHITKKSECIKDIKINGNMGTTKPKTKPSPINNKQHKYIELPDDIESNLLNFDNKNVIYYTTGKDLYLWLNELILSKGIIPKQNTIKINNGVVSSFIFNGVKFWHNENMLICDDIAKKLNINFNNQSLPGLARIAAQQAKINIENVKSKFNIETKKVFSNIKFGGLTYRPNDHKINDNEIIEAYDIKKCYSYVVSTYSLPVFDGTEEIFIYSNEKINNNGFYYINVGNNGRYPIFKNSWYVGYMVAYCLKMNIISKNDIKYHVIPNKKSDDLKKLVSSIYKLCYARSIENKHIKLMINSIIGSLAMTNACSFSSVFTASLEDAYYYMTLYNSFIATSEAHNKTIYRIDKKTDTINILSGKPANIAIVQIGYMLSHMLYMNIKKIDNDALLLIIHVDEVVVQRSNNKIINVDDLALTRRTSINNNGHVEKVEKEFYDITQHIPVGNDPYNHINNKWNVEEIYGFDESVALKLYNKYNDGCYVSGIAGTGKSHLLNHFKNIALKTYADNEIITLAYTNSAVSGKISGKTIHKYFGLTPCNDKIEIYNKKFKDVKVVFIDEVSMIPSNLYILLHIFKETGAKVFIFGDLAQIAPVNDSYDFMNGVLLKQLANYNMLVLTKNYRSALSADFAIKASKGLISRDDIKTNEEPIKFNICYYNKTVDRVNNEMALIYGALGAVGSRIRIIKTIAKFKIVKNQFYEIINNNQIKQLFIDYDNVLNVSINDIIKYCCLGFATTSDKSQGLTIREPYMIYNFDEMDIKRRYVALTRTDDPKKIYITPNDDAIYVVE